ncbi:unnamed protein product [Effrenium voratum]|nr:unnamed protein product [Effrenium voratum]
MVHGILPLRSQSHRRLQRLRKHTRRCRQKRVMMHAGSCRTVLWRIPQSCRRAEEALAWKTFLQKIVWRLEGRLKEFPSCGRAGREQSLEDSEERQLVDAALNQEQLLQNPEEVVCTRYGAELTRRHLSCLLPDEWVNDEVVNAYLRLVQDFSKGVWCPNTFFWPKLEEGGHAAVERWARRAAIDVALLRCIIVPLHLEGCHWALAVMKMSQRTIEYFDSLGLAAPDNLQSRLSEYASMEASALSGCWKLKVATAQLQENTSDCGVFMLAYAECMALGTPMSVDASQVAKKRRAIALTILRGQLLMGRSLNGSADERAHAARDKDKKRVCESERASLQGKRPRCN